ncbi:AAA family ATPase [Candidatus Uhrbacteria bacterium]|nr:AAA family ATPase [Candidatus Uhrbacteria bacterium]
MMPAQIIGHAPILETLRRVKERDRLGHAYLFAGPARVGKTAVARAFMAEVLGTETPLECHPDFILVERGRDAKTGKLHGSIVIEQIHALCNRLSMAAFMGGWKVCLIEGIDWLTADAANALLKNLEEPHPKTLFIATTESLDAVLPTIKSRCEPVRFGRVATAEIAASLVGRGLAQEEAVVLARLADGRPGRAVAYVENPDSRAVAAETIGALAALISAGPAERLAAVDKFLPPALPFIEASERAADLVDRLSELLRDALLVEAGQPDAVMHVGQRDRTAALARRGSRHLAIALETALEAKRMLEENVAPRQSLDHLLLQL